MENSIPEVFIIESLQQGDFREGILIKKILKLGGRNAKHKYVISKNDFLDAVQEFESLNYRYLHISSHGNKNQLFFEFGGMDFLDFGRIVNPHLEGKRVFISACEAVNEVDNRLATTLIRDGKCVSVIGFEKPIRFDLAALFWSNFYFLAFEDKDQNQTKIKITRRIILKNLKNLSKLFSLNVNYYSLSKRKGVKLTSIIC
ncbi:MAG TPA: hypothetical protein DIW44_15700 [Anaerolineaceae bacterium]|nr:hypothetical protein [Anaerolineaceae bacterium]